MRIMKFNVDDRIVRKENAPTNECNKVITGYDNGNYRIYCKPIDKIHTFSGTYVDKHFVLFNPSSTIKKL